jgi:hypothetical protein
LAHNFYLVGYSSIQYTVWIWPTNDMALWCF